MYGDGQRSPFWMSIYLRNMAEEAEVVISDSFCLKDFVQQRCHSSLQPTTCEASCLKTRMSSDVARPSGMVLPRFLRSDVRSVALSCNCIRPSRHGAQNTRSHTKVKCTTNMAHTKFFTFRKDQHENHSITKISETFVNNMSNLRHLKNQFAHQTAANEAMRNVPLTFCRISSVMPASSLGLSALSGPASAAYTCQTRSRTSKSRTVLKRY